MQEMKKGSLGLLILRLLAERPGYGYELCERLRAQSDGDLVFEDGAIYPLLHGYERQGLIEGYWEGERDDAGDGETPRRRGPRRRYYRLTPRGEQALAASLREWRTFSNAMRRILGAADEPGLALARLVGAFVRRGVATATGGRR